MLDPLLLSFVSGDQLIGIPCRSLPYCWDGGGSRLSGTLPVDEVFPGSRSGTSQGGESQGSQEGEETKEEQALNAIIADASEGVQVVLGKWICYCRGMGGWQSPGSEPFFGSLSAPCLYL